MAHSNSRRLATQTSVEGALEAHETTDEGILRPKAILRKSRQSSMIVP